MSIHALRILPLAALLAVVSGRADAQSFVLEFGRNGVVASDGSSPTFTVDPANMMDNPLTLQVYLTQIGGETRLNDVATGLILADFSVTVAGGTELVPVAFGFDPAVWVEDTGGTSGIVGQTARIALFERNGGASGGVTTARDGVADNSVLLGTVTYNVGPIGSGPFTLTASQNPAGLLPSFADAAFNSLTVASGTSTVMVSAVPEPSHFALCGLLVAGFGYRQRRKTKRAKETQPQA